MGWWKVENTEIVVGDEPLERVGEALDDVISMYQEALDRAPTMKEWESILALELGITLGQGGAPEFITALAR